MKRTESARWSELNRRFIPGGMVSLNRKVTPAIVFTRAKGAFVWDADGNKYIDYHAAFAPFLLGHSDSDVDRAVQTAIQEGWALMGSGTTPWEGRCAELLIQCVPALEKVQITTSGSEATFHALRLARAYTGKNHVVVMQGGYNGWHDDVACNVMTPLEQIGPKVQRGEYKWVPLSAGMPHGVADRVHVVNFNDLESVEWAFQKYPVACLITEPILQNIGVVKPKAGYLEGLRTLCDRHGVILVFDEVKTGFRHALGGYQSISGVQADLSTFGKAIANGYPLGAIGGKSEIMNLFESPDPSKRVLIAGTYNGHPIPVAAAIATMEKLLREQNSIYPRLEELGNQLEKGIKGLFEELKVVGTISRQGSAFCFYFMNRIPESWHDIAQNHDFSRDLKFRQALIEKGIYLFPLPTKQGSISAAHTVAEIDQTLEMVKETLLSDQRSVG